jgi:glutamate synthase (NADPH/NADH) large chain
MVALEPVTEEDDLLERELHHGGDIEYKGLVDVLSDMSRGDAERLHRLVANHARFTGSKRAAEILANWAEYLPRFRKVMPVEYRRALAELARQQEEEEAPPLYAAAGE